MKKTKIISVVNQKGGVGKTTTTVNLGTALASIDKKVLLIDLDPQGNLSTGLGVKEDDRGSGVYGLITTNLTVDKVILSSKIPNLNLIASNVNLSGIEFELANSEDKTQKLINKIEKLVGYYDYIIIDCPPSLGILTVNSLVASNSVLVPLQCEFYALEGLAQLLKTVEKIKDNLNNRLYLEGIVLTMYDSRNRLCDDVVEDAKEHLGDKVYETIIPRNVRLSEAPSHGLPAIIYDGSCAGSAAYIKLAKEFIHKSNIY